MDVLVILGLFAGAWLLVACVIYGWFVNTRIQRHSSLSRLAVYSVLAAASLGPGALIGADAVLPIPAGLALAMGILYGNSEWIVLNGSSLAFSAASFLGLSCLLRRRAKSYALH